MSKSLPALLLVFSTICLAAQKPHPVLMISIDGMRPDYVTQADEHHLRIPTLRRLLIDGTYADGVTGVFPTYTYPSHTTLVTGVWPAEHGILNNERFDPLRQFNSAWYWYADQIKVPTLWTAAHTAGLRTASVGWPVTVDDNDIDFLIPEFWRGSSPEYSANPDDVYLMSAISRPQGELNRIAQRVGLPYMNGNDTSVHGDEIKTLYSLDILKQHKPEFMTIHLSALDGQEHEHGPFSPEADAALEQIDGMVARLIAQEKANDSEAFIAIVSDHGFVAIQRSLDLYVPFIEAGLIQTRRSSIGAVAITSWTAEPWALGAGFAIMLRDPNDAATREKVHTLLTQLAADPNNGIEAVLTHDQVLALGGPPQAAFDVTLRPGYSASSSLTGPLVGDSAHRGTHGYNPQTTPAMRSSFFLIGPQIAHGKDVGIIDMRQIAPTLAHLLGVPMPSAKQPPLALP